jgi:hypothetical protein
MPGKSGYNIGTIAFSRSCSTAGRRFRMSNENVPNGNPSVDQETDEKIDRRAVAGRIGRFLAYTAPALLALATAKSATASPG